MTRLKILRLLPLLFAIAVCPCFFGCQTVPVVSQNDSWNLGFIYTGVDDQQLEADVVKIETMSRDFLAYKGQLTSKLGPALADYAAIDMLMNKVAGYLTLQNSLNRADEKVQSRLADVQNRCGQVQGEYLTWFKSELVRLPQSDIKRQADASGEVARLLPFINDIRRTASHLLSDEVESILARRETYGAHSWADFYDAVQSQPESPLQDPTQVLDGYYLDLAAQTLNMIIGEKAIDDADRHYQNPMAARNEENGLPDEMVEAFHRSVKETAAPLARRYFRLKAAILGLTTLASSDLHAKLPGSSQTKLSFDEGFRTVVAAYGSFSPTLARLVQQMRDEKRIDAAPRPAKATGAFDLSLVLPGNRPVSFVLLTYNGGADDVTTLAHELGHAAHGLLAGEAQGPLMYNPPAAYAETASRFGELLAFNYLRAETEKTGDKRALLALLTTEIEEIISTDVAQIVFSNFERRIHAAKKRLTVAEFDAFWIESRNEMYGPDGEDITYGPNLHNWARIPHFHRPFYVYSYSLGDLLVQSLYAQRDRLGDRFEPLYLDMLRAGGTKGAVELLQPFGLDPRRTDFWDQGINSGLGDLITETEKLARELGYKVK